MRKITISFFVLSLITAVTPLYAQSGGTSWLRLPVNTANAALGQSLGAVGDGVDSLSINPAGLTWFHGHQIIFSQNFWVQGISIEHLVYGQSLSNGLQIALGGDYVGFGNVAQYAVSGGVPVQNGSYSPLGLNLSAGIGLELTSTLRVGMTGRFLYEDIQTPAGETVSGDIGISYRVPKTRLFFGGVLQGLGPDLDGASLPLRAGLAAAWQLDLAAKADLTLSTQGDLMLQDANLSDLGFGGEYCFKNVLALRAGYRLAPYGDLNGVTGLSAGVGVSYTGWKLDYALTTLGDLGTASLLSLGFKW